MKLIETITDLVQARQKREQEIQVAIFNVLYALGNLECGTTIFRMSDCDRRVWVIAGISLGPSNDIQIKAEQSDNFGQAPSLYDDLPFEEVDAEDVLYAVYGILKEMSPDDLNSRLLEKADDLAMVDMLKKYGLSEEDFYAGENLKPEFQDEFQDLYLDHMDKLSDMLPREHPVICTVCGRTDVSCDASANPNTGELINIADGAFYDGNCANCGWVVLSDVKEVTDSIMSKYQRYKTEFGEPLFVDCTVAYTEQGPEGINEHKAVTIKLSPEVIPAEGERIFFNCENFEEFKSFVRPTPKVDFVVIECGFYFNNLKS